MPKTVEGTELQLDDGPARECDLFLVDGNNLAYRAFFALPEELATSDGFPTNALLGFTNMLFKLLTDYKPKAVAVAWDTRPTERAARATTQIYKEGRREMADLLREQFPYFRPIVDAFGYRNLEFEGWEADDVIATLATRADEAGIKTTIVSTDRDAFQLVTENVALMMTPRGVSDVHVYTPERVGTSPMRWREEMTLPVAAGPVGVATVEGRTAVATGDEVVIATAPAPEFAEAAAHDAKAQRLQVADDTLLAAYLIEPGRATYE